MWWKVLATCKHIGLKTIIIACDEKCLQLVNTWLQTIIIAKFIDLDNGLINSHKHRVGIDKISYSMS